MVFDESSTEAKPAALSAIKFEKNEWRWVSFYAVFLTVLISIPFLIGFLSQTSTQYFSGGLIGIDDFNSYLAKMNQGAHGAWLFRLPYSSEPQNGAPIYWFYLLLGKISGPEFTHRVITFHFARCVFGFILTLVIYKFVAEFIPQINQRRMSLIVATVGGGLGWAMIVFGINNVSGPPPLEFHSPEAFSLLMLLTFPHLLLARSLLLIALQTFLHQRYIVTGLALILLCLIQPVDVIIVWLILGLYSLLIVFAEKRYSPGNFWKKLKPLFIIGIISSPFVLYYAYLFTSDSILKQWNAQNIIASPSPIYFLSSYGLYLILAIPGLKSLRGYRPDLWLLSIAWILLIPIFIYIPIGFQRRLIEGFQILLAALAILGVAAIQSNNRSRLILYIPFILFPSSLMLFLGAIQSASRVRLPAFQPADEIAVFNWLDRNTKPDQIVISTYSTGNFLPVHTSLTPYIGHHVETIFFADKKLQVASFYQDATNNNERLDLINKERIAYIFYGPDERKLGDLNPSSLPYLIKRYEQGNYSVYQVILK